MTESSTNSLGLDFNNLSVKDTVEHTQTPDGSQVPETQPTDVVPKDVKEKKKPYVNPERVKTGGAQREKLSEEELVVRMQRIKEQNEKIKQRRLDVQADEDAFKKTQEADRLRQVQQRKVQEAVDRTREQNARRKMEKVQNREWDSGKSASDWKQAKKPAGSSEATPDSSQPGRGGRGRGNGRGGPEATTDSSQPGRRGRGRGNGRGGPSRGRGRGRGASSAAGLASQMTQVDEPQVANVALPASEAATTVTEEPEAVGIAS